MKASTRKYLKREDGNDNVASTFAKILTELKSQTKVIVSNERSALFEVPDVQRFQLKRDKVYTFSRSFGIGQITTGPTSISGAYSVTLASIPGYTEFTALFDQYRIIQVTIQFSPINVGAVALPIISVIDYDDANVPSTADELRQYQTLRTVTGTQYFERTFTPRIAMAAYGNGVFNSFATQSPSIWLDSASSSIPYYGLKYYWTGRTGTDAGYDVVASIILQTRNPR